MPQQHNNNARVYGGINSSLSPVYFSWPRSPRGSTPSQLDLIQYASPQDQPRTYMNGQAPGYQPMQGGPSANEHSGYQYPQGVLGAGPPLGNQHSQGRGSQTPQMPPAREPIRGGAYNFSTAPVRRSWVWFCCFSDCGNGPFNTDMYVQCIFCEHYRCRTCRVECVEVRDPCYGQRRS
jgi:hypothetical protein